MTDFFIAHPVSLFDEEPTPSTDVKIARAFEQLDSTTQARLRRLNLKYDKVQARLRDLHDRIEVTERMENDLLRCMGELLAIDPEELGYVEPSDR